MYRRIAVALDAGPDSRIALRWAVSIARRANCPLDLVRVAVPAVHGGELYAASLLSDEDVERMELESMQSLRDVADEVSSAGVRATPVVLRGSVPSVLADHLRENEVDLVVMTTHDRGRLERLLLGSVSSAVMRHAHIPALLIRAHESDAGAHTGVDEEPSVQRILVPLDGSPFGDQILAPATTLARLMNARLTLLSIVEPMLANAALATGIDGVPAAPLVARPTDAAGHEEQTALESATLERTAARIRQLHLSVDTQVLIDARPAHAIVDFASRHHIDLIAMTTHGRGALQRFVAGSVSEAVLHTAAAPHMLLYRPQNPAPS